MNETPWMDWLKLHINQPCKTGYPPSDFNRQCFKHTDFGDLGNVLPPSCAATACAALEETGFKSPHSAAAISFKDYGTPCELKFGAIIVIEHLTGGLKGHHHVTFYDHSAGKDQVTCIGGNQDHMLKYSTLALGVDHKIIATRWPAHGS